MALQTAKIIKISESGRQIYLHRLFQKVLEA